MLINIKYILCIIYVYFMINSLKNKKCEIVEFIFDIILGIRVKIWIQIDDCKEWYKM